VTEVVAWAASSGDRSENADYQYGKRRLKRGGVPARGKTKRFSRFVGYIVQSAIIGEVAPDTAAKDLRSCSPARDFHAVDGSRH
jgi:hypothetical protein